MSACQFRIASDADVDAIVALAHSAYRGDASRAGWTTEADLLDGPRTDAEQVRAMLVGEQAILLALADDDTLMACCHLSQVDDTCWFGLFAVTPTAQGQGLGDAVLAQAERWACERHGAQRMAMKVIWSRDTLIAWYQRRGYQPTGRRHAFPYDDPRCGIPLREDLYFIELAKPLANDNGA